MDEVNIRMQLDVVAIKILFKLALLKVNERSLRNHKGYQRPWRRGGLKFKLARSLRNQDQDDNS